MDPVLVPLTKTAGGWARSVNNDNPRRSGFTEAYLNWVWEYPHALNSGDEAVPDRQFSAFQGQHWLNTPIAGRIAVLD